MFTEVFVNTHAWDDSRISAVVIDQGGRRTGWTTDGPLREIVGCSAGYGTEEGIPNPEDEADPLADTFEGSARISDPPKYVYFHISNDAVTPIGLIDQGGCELRVEAIVPGKVQLGVSANRAGRILCQDSTSVWVKVGVPLRYRLSWKAERETCVVKLSRLAGTKLQVRKPASKRGR